MSQEPPSETSDVEDESTFLLREHAAAYASAAAGAAWAAAHLAQQAAHFAATGQGPPPPGMTPYYWNMPLTHHANDCYHSYPPPYYYYSNHHDNHNLSYYFASSSSDSNNNNNHHNDDNNPSSPRDKLRRKRQPQTTDDASSIGKTPRRNVTYRSDGSTSSGGTSQRKHRKKTDQSLVGKKAVSALYEWCSKRQRVPTFAEIDTTDNDYTFVVLLQGEELGRGRASTKGAAKDLAARKALATLLPGVLFDPRTGILVALPSSATDADELAPNLAKRLAIIGDSRTTALKRTLDSTSEDDYYASRGASVCSALLYAMLQIDTRLKEPPTYQYQLHPEVSGHIRVHRGSFTCHAQLATNEQIVLQATGTGGTKREARHVASAKLLAQLFPECETMLQVKAAAEAAREEYAANKARKMENNEGKITAKRELVQTLLAKKDECEIPKEIREIVLWNDKERSNSPSKVSSDENESDPLDRKPAAIDVHSRRLASRKRQLESMVERALQTLQERDEEGRILPEELTEDDVGRTVLRQATSEDWGNIKRMLHKSPHRKDGPLSILTSNDENSLGNIWSASSLSLLLCRAIAAYEDPPLGCAVLTLGFSMERGRSLRLVDMVRGPHLPRERFIECLQDFASTMNCVLEDQSHTVPATTKSTIVLDTNDLREIIQSYYSNLDESTEKQSPTCEFKNDKSHFQLQSVKEEDDEEVSDASSLNDDKARLTSKRSSKPSKRTRVA